MSNERQLLAQRKSNGIDQITSALLPLLAGQTREALAAWIQQANLSSEDYLFKSRCKRAEHISTRQYARIVSGWVTSIGLDPAEYGTHSIRRTKVSMIYRSTRNLRAVQLLLGHRELESMVRESTLFIHNFGNRLNPPPNVDIHIFLIWFGMKARKRCTGSYSIYCIVNIDRQTHSVKFHQDYAFLWQAPSLRDV